jgi:hypothetical protein
VTRKIVYTMTPDLDPSSYNSPLTRRKFLKATGGATAATILAFHGTQQISLGGLIFHLLTINAHAQPVPVPGQPGQSMLTVDISYDLENPDSVPHAVGLGLYDISGNNAILISSRTIITVPAGTRVGQGGTGSIVATLPYANFNNPPGVPAAGTQMDIRLVTHPNQTQAWSNFTWQ